MHLEKTLKGALAFYPALVWRRIIRRDKGLD
jgi:hypothetical protein